MCSIPGLPKVGSDITVHLTRVNLNPHSVLVAFGGNLNNGQQTRDVTQVNELKEIEVPSMKQHNFEGDPGDVCLAYEDKTWYRARILSRYEHEYYVFLIDDGKSLWASSKSLANCPHNLCSVPPKVELCILTGVSPLCLESTWSQGASKFIRSLCGKSISGRVQDVLTPNRIILLDIPVVSKQMYELGFARKMPNKDFKNLVTSSLLSPKGNASDFAMTNGQNEHANDPDKLHQYLYPELLPGTIEIVTVTQVIHPLKFFCKLHVFSQELKKLSEQLHKYYEGAFPSLMPTILSDGSPCATKGSDGKWYRSVLQQNTFSDVVKVFHVDYGIGDFVKLCNIRPLSARFFQLPVVNYACSLHGIMDKGIGWRTDQIDYLKSIVLDQIFIGKFENHSLCKDVYDVTLFGNDNMIVNNTFGHKQKCLSMKELTCADKTLETLNKVTYQNKSDRNNVPVGSLNTTALTGCSDSLEDVIVPSRTEANQGTTERIHSLKNAAARSPIQSDSYIVSPPKIEVGTKEKVQITCVQSVNKFYGHFVQNTEIVKKMTKEIQQLCCRRLQANFSVSPKMMCLARYTDGQWHRGQIELTHPKILVHFVDYGDLVTLDKSDILPITHKVDAIMSIPIQAVQFELFNVLLPKSCELNEWFKNYVTDCMFNVIVMKRNPSGKLSVEMYDETINLNSKMREKLNKTNRKGCNINKGTDETRTCKVSSEGMESRGVRYGLSATLQAQEKISGTISKPVVQSTLKQNGNYQTIKDHSNGHSKARPRQQVDEQQQVNCCYPKLIDLPSRAFDAGYVSDIYLSHCNSPSSFFVQLTSDEDAVFSLLDKLNSSQLNDAQVDINSLQPGDLVKAEYPADGAWYRAVVQSKRDGMVQVQFIDFGNEATLAPLKIRQLGKQFLNTPRLSIHCSLEDDKTGRSRDWTKEEIMAFKKAAGENGEKKILCKLIRENTSAWLVSLEYQGVVLKGPLFNVSKTLKPRAQTESPIHCTEDTHPIIFKEPAVTQGQIVDAYASSIVGPNYFWCQFKNSAELDKISLIAQEIGNSTMTKPIQPDQLCPGDPCLACFSDKLWYRAQVIKKFTNTVSVVFIDYGNESEIDLNSVKSLPPKLLDSLPQAFLCQLGGFEPTEGTWSDAAADKFFELLVDELLKVTIQNKAKSSNIPHCPQYNTLVECQGLVVNDFLKDYWSDSKPQVCSQAAADPTTKTIAGKNTFGDKKPVMHPETVKTDITPKHTPMDPKLSALDLPQVANLPPHVIEPGAVSEVYISHINSLTSFFVQLAEDENTLFSLNERLNFPQSSEEDVIQASSIQQGSLVKAMFPDDESWYRAVVKDMPGNGMVKVEFIDFGNEATVSPLQICRLDEWLLSYPRFSIHCSSNMDDRFKGQGLEEIFLLKKLFGEAGENKLSCKFIKEDITTWEVNMTLKGSTSDSSLSEKWDNLDFKALHSHSPTQMLPQVVVSTPVKDTFQLLFKKPEVSLGQTVEAFASCIVGPNYFWCQFANSEKLDQITIIADEYGNSSETKPIQMDQLDLGSPCLARFSDDQMWYRAQVINKCTDTISVLFVDYGNESEVNESSVKTLPCNLLESPHQAFLCRLEGFGPSEGSWDSTAADNLYELLVDKPLKVTIQCIDHTVDANSPPYYVSVETQQCLVNEVMKNFWSASVHHDQNSAEVIDCFASTSEDHPVSEDKSRRVSLESCTGDNQISEPHCASQLGADQLEELLVNGDLHGVPENKVGDWLDGTDVIPLTNSDDPTQKNLLLENHSSSHESIDGVPVESTEQMLLHIEENRKDMEDARCEKEIPMTKSGSTSWAASLENPVLPFVCSEDSCYPTKCIFK
ncbi:tudor domain-containing 6 [Myxocyprinus asiaticus]|uniref:tudor domain-containing 6 n=1 Tax=Myxocyprinus asiaticus TaxID=70543 RepID=UPI0022235FF1|nr:tudor domain-containing 6 [Myxocyprinus asiaticus]XP_051501777.1 tudor domain-containing 6 [Myxocyprinus asiaticus]